MKVLITYATTEGQTSKIAGFIADQLISMGLDAELHDSLRRRQSVHADDYDAFVVAGSVHQERHQREIEAFVASCLKTLQTKPNLFVSVSLAAAFDAKAADAKNYIKDFQLRTGWTPALSLPVAGAIKSEEYDYFQQQILEHVVMCDDETFKSEESREFTDWETLADEVNKFAARLE